MAWLGLALAGMVPGPAQAVETAPPQRQRPQGQAVPSGAGARAPEPTGTVTGSEPAPAPSSSSTPPEIPLPEGQRVRPPNLLVLQERLSHQGRFSIGVFDATADPAVAGLWRVKVWREVADRVEVAVDVVGCSPSGPMRLTGSGDRLIMRQLNPGGMITSANRLDHLIWWAVCAPEQAGRDPATLTGVARQMGFSGTLVESEQVLPAPPR